MTTVGILGGGDALEVIQGDAYYQSYICRIPRSTIELGLTGRLNGLDGMLFPPPWDAPLARLEASRAGEEEDANPPTERERR